MMHDPQEKPYRLIEQFLRATPNPTIVELGMCDGYHTGMLLSWCRNPRYYAFEPDPRNVAVIKGIGMDRKVNFCAAAVGNRCGKVPFHLATPEPNGGIGSSSISDFTPVLTQCWPWLKQQATIEVDCWTLDAFCQVERIEAIDFIWMDVQGAERLVFEGAQRMLPRTRLLWTEYDGGNLYADSSTLADILKWFPGWEVLANCGGDVLLKNCNSSIGAAPDKPASPLERPGVQ